MRPHALGALILGVMALHMASARADDDGPFEVRLRAVYLDPANKSDAIPALAVPSDAIHVNSKVLPDVDLEYFFTPHWSSELILTYPQLQTVTIEKSALGGPTQIGTFRHLPPILTAKYNFLPQNDFQPYVGVGVNLTLISKVDLAVPTVGKLTLDSSSVGPALQAGFDYRIAKHWYLNADVKWAKIGSDLGLVGVGKVSTVHVDPFLFGVGIGYRFGGHEAAAALPVAASAPPVEQPSAAPAPMVAAPVAKPAPPPPPVAVLPPTPREELVLRGVTFETASAVLTPESSAVLDGVVGTLQQAPKSSAEVRGYTDSTGSPAYNQKLSERRAQAVVNYLVAHGATASRLSAEGMGPQNPVASNQTAAGRAQNRRVTIQFSHQVSN